MRDVPDDILFFSGGTALNGTAKILADRGCDCAYVITTFDSGGSSAVLRKAFNMPAVGDIRSRILALADTTREGMRGLCALFNYRLPASAASLNAAPHSSPAKQTTPCSPARRELEQIALGTHPLCDGLSPTHAELVREYTAFFLAEASDDFPCAGAGVGNIFLAAHYLQHQRSLSAAADSLARLTHARGAVLPATEYSAYLSVRTAAGEWIVGQHRFTGKPASAYPRLSSPIAEIRLTGRPARGPRAGESAPPAPLVPAPAYTPDLLRRIERAKAICFPPGSFYSSIIAGLLPAGAGRSVAACKGPKLFVPNLGADPELFGHTVRMQVERLLAVLGRDLRPPVKGRSNEAAFEANGGEVAPKELLSLVVTDEDAGRYPGGIPQTWLAELGIGVARFPLVTRRSAPLADPERLAEALLRSCQGLC